MWSLSPLPVYVYVHMIMMCCRCQQPHVMSLAGCLKTMEIGWTVLFASMLPLKLTACDDSDRQWMYATCLYLVSMLMVVASEYIFIYAMNGAYYAITTAMLKWPHKMFYCWFNLSSSCKFSLLLLVVCVCVCDVCLLLINKLNSNDAHILLLHICINAYIE